MAGGVDGLVIGIGIWDLGLRDEGSGGGGMARILNYLMDLLRLIWVWVWVWVLF